MTALRGHSGTPAQASAGLTLVCASVGQVSSSLSPERVRGERQGWRDVPRGILSAVRAAMTSVAELASVDHGEVIVESGLTYDGTTPVLVCISKRDGRHRVTDDGRAVSVAGGAGGNVTYPEQFDLAEYSVNVSRQGVVWLPAVRPSEEWLATISELVARGSVALYEQLLELEEGE